MTIKNVAYSAQHHLETSTGHSFKRAHLYELLAASFGFNSYAALGKDTVFAELHQSDRRVVLERTHITRRCIELGYQPDIATLASSALESFLAKHRIGVASIPWLVSRLRGESPGQDEENEDQAFGPVLLDGLAAAASKGNALAHYALALIHDPQREDDRDAGSPYWYAQKQQGRVLSGVEKEWAEAHEARLVQAEKHSRHLREASRLGNEDALLRLADRFDDPTFFEQPRDGVDADPAAIAAIAGRMGRTSAAKRWLTLAAERGDTDAMLQLIEEHDQGDLQRCWTWVYLSQLVGRDLTRDAYYAINEDGSAYNDDAGGPVYAAGRDGVDLEPLASAQDGAARLAAQRLFEQIK